MSLILAENNQLSSFISKNNGNYSHILRKDFVKE